MAAVKVVIGYAGPFEGVPPGLSPWTLGWAESSRQITEATIAEIVNPLEAQEAEDFVETLRNRLRAKGFSRVAELIRIESDMPHRQLLKTCLFHSDALSPIGVRQRGRAAIDSKTKIICAVWIQGFAESVLDPYEEFLHRVHRQGVTREEAHKKLLKSIDFTIDMFCTRDDSTLIQAELSPFLLSTQEQAWLPTQADVILKYYPDKQDYAESTRKRATDALKLLL